MLDFFTAEPGGGASGLEERIVEGIGVGAE
jgi:hypothetical protein